MFSSEKNIISLVRDCVISWVWHHINGLVQERRNSMPNALELHFSCTYPLTWASCHFKSLTSPVFIWKLFQSNSKGNIKGLYQRYIVRGSHFSIMLQYLKFAGRPSLFVICYDLCISRTVPPQEAQFTQYASVHVYIDLPISLTLIAVMH